jgi:hypothetical protein
MLDLKRNKEQEPPGNHKETSNDQIGKQVFKLGSHAIGNRNCSNVACLANQINNGLVLFAPL